MLELKTQGSGIRLKLKLKALAQGASSRFNPKSQAYGSSPGIKHKTYFPDSRLKLKAQSQDSKTRDNTET